jgi:transmembrane sensor
MKQNTNDEIKRIFKLYLEEKSSPEQEEILFAFVREQENSETFFKDIINETWNQDIQIAERNGTAKRSLRWLQYAASLFLIFSVALGWYMTRSSNETIGEQITWISKTTHRGQKLKLLLPDSSVVFLNASSKISFPKHFIAGKNREIRLEGEAFFEVKHDKSRPFIVHSGSFQTRVLGTSFNISAYITEKTFSVGVRTGKVGVSALQGGKQQHLSLLTPGNRLVYQLNSKQYKIDQQKATDYSGWTENRFIFKNEMLATIISSLERSYNINFEVKDKKMLTCRFNVTFFNRNIRDIADQLTTMSGGNLHYKFSPDKTIITLWGEACQ